MGQSGACRSLCHEHHATVDGGGPPPAQTSPFRPLPAQRRSSGRHARPVGIRSEDLIHRPRWSIATHEAAQWQSRAISQVAKSSVRVGTRSARHRAGRIEDVLAGRAFVCVDGAPHSDVFVPQFHAHGRAHAAIVGRRAIVTAACFTTPIPDGSMTSRASRGQL